MKSQPTALDVLDSRFKREDIEAFSQLKDQYVLLRPHHWQFEVVPGQFRQLDTATDDTQFNYLTSQMGVQTLWPEVLDTLDKLNKEADEDTVYKVLYLARHGQGYHNKAHLHFGDDAWNETWLKLDGDGQWTWGPDPELTELGQAQARDNRDGWKQVIDAVGTRVVPHKFYLLPLRRSADTLVLTWGDLVDFHEAKPQIREGLREQMGVHTCDKRSPRAVIAAKYTPQGFEIEPGFAEEDIYYKDDYRETIAEQAVRMYGAFNQIFDETRRSELIVAVTTHLGAIRTQLLLLGHRQFAVGTGGSIPVFVKATRVTPARF